MLTVLSVAFPFALVNADPVGGAEQVLAHIDRSLVDAGHNSIVLAADGSQSAGDLITVPRPASPIGRHEWDAVHQFLRVAIARTVKARNVDLVHLHGVDFFNYLPNSNVRVLATLHLPLSYYPVEAFTADRPHTWFNAVSSLQRRSIGSTMPLAAVIENGVVPPPGPAPGKEGFALAMGRICPEKGFHLALDAAKAANVPMRLAGSIAGFSEHKDYFEREIVPRLDSDRQWVGPVSGATKWRLLAAARCVLVPSLVAETASLVAREALAAGTPVIAFPNGALPEIIEHGHTGFLVNNVGTMAEAMSRVDEIAPSTCRFAAETKYSAARMTQQYLDLYQRLTEIG
jgi:glycosyltransferase involved in cell wall biosynthesis